MKKKECNKVVAIMMAVALTLFQVPFVYGANSAEDLVVNTNAESEDFISEDALDDEESLEIEPLLNSESEQQTEIITSIAELDETVLPQVSAEIAKTTANFSVDDILVKPTSDDEGKIIYANGATTTIGKTADLSKYIVSFEVVGADNSIRTFYLGAADEIKENEADARDFGSFESYVIVGGSKGGVVESVDITIEDVGVASIVGGSIAGGVVQKNIVVNINNLEINGELLGAGDDAYAMGNVNLNIANSMIYSNVFGGGADSFIGYSSANEKNAEKSIIEVDVKNTEFYGNLYGGGMSSVLNADTIVNIRDEVFEDEAQTRIRSSVYGGGKRDVIIGNTTVNIHSGRIDGSVYGGIGYSDSSDWSRNVEKPSLEVGEIDFNVVHGNTNVNIHSGEIYGNVYGGGTDDIIVGNTNVKISGDTYIRGSVYGGISGAGIEVSSVEKNIMYSVVHSNTYVEIAGSDVLIEGNVFGGGYFDKILGNTNVTMTNGNVVGTVYGGIDSLFGVIGRALVKPSEADLENGYSIVHGDTKVIVSGGLIGINPMRPSFKIVGGVFGGGRSDIIAGSTYVEISGEDAFVVGSVYGGVDVDHNSFYEDTNNLSYGMVLGSTDVNILAGGVGQNVFGGGYGDSIHMNTDVEVSGGEIFGGVFGGIEALPLNYGFGKGVSAEVESELVSNEFGVVNGSTNVLIGGTAWVEGSVFGGGYFDFVEVDTNVEITGNSNIVGSVYGGGFITAIGENTFVKVSGGVIGAQSVDEGYYPNYGSADEVPHVSKGEVYGGGIGMWPFDIDGNNLSVTGYHAVNPPNGVSVKNGVGNVQIVIDAGNIKNSVNGGGRGLSVVVGNADIIINGGTIEEDVYAGGSFIGYYLDVNEEYPSIDEIDGSGDVSIKAFGGTILGDIIASGRLEDYSSHMFIAGGNSSYSAGDAFIFVDANVNLDGDIYKHDSIIGEATLETGYIQMLFPPQIAGETTIVLENETSKILGNREKGEIEPSDSEMNIIGEESIDSIENILRWYKESSYTQAHWVMGQLDDNADEAEYSTDLVTPNVVLPIDVSDAIAITVGQELYIPIKAELSTEGALTNEGYIITMIPELDLSIEKNNVMGMTNIQSRIYRGGLSNWLQIEDATYIVGDSAKILDATASTDPIWNFLYANGFNSKVKQSGNYVWKSGASVLAGIISSMYTPSTDKAGETIYTVNVTMEHAFESVPDGILTDATDSDTAIITVLEKYNLTVNDGSGSGDYLEGAEVPVSHDDAQTPEGEEFIGWDTDGDGDVDVITEDFIFTMPDEDTVISPVYQPIPQPAPQPPVEDEFILTVVDGDGDGTYPEGERVDITHNDGATPEGEEFIGWDTDGDGDVDVTTEDFIFTMPDEDTVISPVYQPVPQPPVEDEFILTVVDGNGGGTYPEGERVDVTHNDGDTPEGEAFIGWDTNGDGDVDVTDKDFTFTMPDEDTTITPVYKDLGDIIVGPTDPEIDDGTIIIRPIIPGTFPDDVIMDGVTLTPPDDFTIGEGNTIIITSNFLATLENGDHTLTLTYGESTFESTIIMSNGVPLSAGPFALVGNAWSLFDLIMTIIVILIPIIFVMVARRKKSEDENSSHETQEQDEYDDEKEQASENRKLIFAIGAVLAVITVVLLLLTQDFTQPMGIFDKWSICFAIIFVVQLIFAIIFGRQQGNDDESDYEKNTA